MSAENIIRYKKGMKSLTDWTRIKAMKDEDIDYSDNPATDEAFWEDAEWVEPKSTPSTTVCLNRRILNWFKKQGPGYQNRINAVLENYIEAQSHSGKQKKKAG